MGVPGNSNLIKDSGAFLCHIVFSEQPIVVNVVS